MNAHLDAGRIVAQLHRVVTETEFDGVVRVDDAGGTVTVQAHGLADRAHDIPNTVDTRFGVASGSKLLTALAVMRLVEDGVLSLDTTARSLLGDDLPLIADDVSVEHLLAHRSGIGDYIDEEQLDDIADFELTVPVHTLTTTEAFLPMLDGYPAVFPAGERCVYNNGGYVVLALLAERASGRGYHELVDELVIRPARMSATAFLRLDELPGDAATGYLHPRTDPLRLRTNVLRLPVLATGDGGAFTTAADVHTMWDAFFAGRIVAPATRNLMVRPIGSQDGGLRCGLGVFLAANEPAVYSEGHDAGSSFLTRHDPARHLTYTVLSNTSEGAWPIAEVLRELNDAS